MPSLLERAPAPGPVALTLASVALAFLLHWFGVPLLDLVELRTYDLRFRSSRLSRQALDDFWMMAA